MGFVVRAAIAALSIASIGPAIAGDGEGPVNNSQFTGLPGVIAELPVQSAPLVAVAQDGKAAQTYVTQSNDLVSLFPPTDNGGDNR
jgi:hypothetical protein